MGLTGFNIVPNPWVPEHTLIVGPKTYEALTGMSYDEAVKAFGKALRDKRKPRKPKVQP